MIKNMLILLLLIPGFVFAVETAIPLDEMEPDLNDKASLQRGMKTFMNYCHACHSLKYQRYQRTADDLGIPHNLMMEHLVFDPSAQIGALMDNVLSDDTAKQWFGAAPPDLTLYTQLKGGPGYFYTYMRSFYEDPTRPFGVNNLLFENVGMPHVLLDLQGVQRKVCKDIPKLAANGGEVRDPLTGESVSEEKCGEELIERGYSPLGLVEGTGQLSLEEYDQVIYDLANFLYYTGDPSRQDRERIGIYVLLFLAFFYVFTHLLGREYSKEFH
ncbi:MAG: cytochrome c1 [Gammaproteobacteria bacterium]|jgi:cytochrome c1|nr:cytochrome c1 [Gammaproteobacteria bacterium]MBT4494263.1 cytochrome c1 [Gammaproteobacteria bacterium]MBT7369583.1 cytochrome c1 [Gammaproteobacteria bacterium]